MSTTIIPIFLNYHNNNKLTFSVTDENNRNLSCECEPIKVFTHKEDIKKLSCFCEVREDYKTERESFHPIATLILMFIFVTPIILTIWFGYKDFYKTWSK